MIDRNTLTEWIEEAKVKAESFANIAIYQFNELHRFDNPDDYDKAKCEYRKDQVKTLQGSKIFHPDNTEKSITDMIFLEPEFDLESKIFQSSEVEIWFAEKTKKQWIISSIEPTWRAYKILDWINSGTTTSKDKRHRTKPTFKDLLNTQGQNLIEHLQSEYHHAAPEDVFYMLKSLEGAGYLVTDIDQMIKTHLTDALTIFLGQKYTRQGLNLTRTEVDPVKLATHQNRIKPPAK